MEFLGPIFIAAMTTIGGMVATIFAARRLGRLGLGDAQLQVNKTLRELADAKSAEAEVWKSKFEEEVTAHAATKLKLTADLEYYQRAADDANRRLDNMYADVRRTGAGAQFQPDTRGDDRR